MYPNGGRPGQIVVPPTRMVVVTPTIPFRAMLGAHAPRIASNSVHAHLAYPRARARANEQRITMADLSKRGQSRDEPSLTSGHLRWISPCVWSKSA